MNSWRGWLSLSQTEALTMINRLGSECRMKMLFERSDWARVGNITSCSRHGRPGACLHRGGTAPTSCFLGRKAQLAAVRPAVRPLDRSESSLGRGAFSHYILPGFLI